MNVSVRKVSCSTRHPILSGFISTIDAIILGIPWNILLVGSSFLIGKSFQPKRGAGEHRLEGLKGDGYPCPMGLRPSRDGWATVSHPGCGPVCPWGCGATPWTAIWHLAQDLNLTATALTKCKDTTVVNDASNLRGNCFPPGSRPQHNWRQGAGHSIPPELPHPHNSVQVRKGGRGHGLYIKKRIKNL